MHVPVGYNKFTCECNPPAACRHVSGVGRIPRLEIQFGRDIGSDEISVLDQIGLRLGIPCVSRNALILLGKTGLYQAVQPAATERLDE